MNFLILLSGMVPFNREVQFQMSLLRTFCRMWHKGKMCLSTEYIECSNIRNKRLKCPHRAQTNENSELLLEKKEEYVVGQNRDQSNSTKG